MPFVIILIIGAIFLYKMLNSDNDNTSKTTNTSATMPANVSGIVEFLRGYSSLSRSHTIYGEGIMLHWYNSDFGTEIIVSTRIHKIDSRDAADVAKDLRDIIEQTKKKIEKSMSKNYDPIKIYNEKKKYEDEKVLRFFGTDHLHGSFWDVLETDCIDGKCLTFKARCTAFKHLNQSGEKTIEIIREKILEKYPAAKIESRDNNSMRIAM